MKNSNGMRPQDVAVLLKIVRMGKQPWLAKDLAAALHLSPAEVSNSLSRSALAGLLDSSKRVYLGTGPDGIFEQAHDTRYGLLLRTLPEKYRGRNMDYCSSLTPLFFRF